MHSVCGCAENWVRPYKGDLINRSQPSPTRPISPTLGVTRPISGGQAISQEPHVLDHMSLPHPASMANLITFERLVPEIPHVRTTRPVTIIRSYLSHMEAG